MNTRADGRALASRLARWLVDKARPHDAVELLCAWAAQGPNDAESQALLAAALRVDSASPLTRQAFEAMEGLSSHRPELEAAVAKYTPEALAELEREADRPGFRRAQMGFNNNLKHKGAVFHVQTEDSGLDRPHVITHLFADGGRIIKSTKRTYASEVQRDDVEQFVRTLMKAQHMEMVLALRDGKYDEVIAGRAAGGMDVLDSLPDPDIVARATQRKGEPRDKATERPPPPPTPPPEVAPLFRLHVVRSLWDAPDYYDARRAYVEMGRAGTITLEGERFCHPREAALHVREGAQGAREVWLQDLEGGNGVFVRIRRPTELSIGDEFVIGDQLLRIERNPVPDDEPDPAPTYCYSSPRRPSPFRVVQILEGGALGACTVARGTTLHIGTGWCDLVLRDPLVSEVHCLVDDQAGVILLTDLGSRTGVFVRANGEQRLRHGDELLVGRTRLVVDLTITG